jgi:hypothetical protein
MALGVRRRLDNARDVVDAEIGFNTPPGPRYSEHSSHRRHSVTDSVIIATGSALEQATLLRFDCRQQPVDVLFRLAK